MLGWCVGRLCVGILFGERFGSGRDGAEGGFVLSDVGTERLDELIGNGEGEDDAGDDGIGLIEPKDKVNQELMWS